MSKPDTGYQIAPTSMQWIHDYIEANLSSDLPLKTLAAEIGLSLHYFCRGFKQATGVSPHQFVLAKRLETAANLIVNTDTQLADIAAAVGFADASSFGKAFRKRYSMTPGEFRRVNASVPA